MHLTHLGRAVAGLAIAAVTSSALALPASAQDSGTFDGAALEAFAATHAAGRYSAADLTNEGANVDGIESLADLACKTSEAAPSADLVLIDYQDTGVGPEAFTVSADVNIDDDPSTREVTCNFAVLLTDDGTSFNGTYSFTVGSELDINDTVSGPVSGDLIGIGPIFTDIRTYAEGVLSASGNQLTPSQRLVNVPTTTAKTPAQLASAKKAYNKKVKAAKKAYKKAGKTKKAKKAYKKKLAKAKTAYRKAIAPTAGVIAQPQAFVATFPYSISIQMDDEDALS